MRETWRPIPGWERWYEVSSLGRVRSAHVAGRGKRGGVMRLRHDRCGYLHVRLYNGMGESSYQRVHRLVMLAFTTPDPERPCVHHIDHNKQNNHLDNLAWCTHSENTQAARDAGRIVATPTCWGVDHPHCKLNDAKVRVIRRCREQGMLLRDVADVFGVTMATVSGIASGRGWKHVSHPGEERAA